MGRDKADFGVFNNFDLDGLDVNNSSMNFIANFSFEDTLKDAELSLGPRETFQEAADTTRNSLALTDSHLPSNEKSDAASPKSPLPMHPSSTRAPQHIRNLISMRVAGSKLSEKRRMSHKKGRSAQHKSSHYILGT